MSMFEYVEFSFRGIARRMDYDSHYRIKYQKNESNYSKDPKFVDVIAMIVGSAYVSKKVGSDIYQIIAGFIFSTHCVMRCGRNYGSHKSNWDACIVHYPKFLKKGKCYLRDDDDGSIEILKDEYEAQEYTYYELPEWWDEYLMID